jgi:putative aminopeptidase FrvX
MLTPSLKAALSVRRPVTYNGVHMGHRFVVLLLSVICLITSLSTAQSVSFRVKPEPQIMDRLKLASAKNEDRQATLKKLFADENCTGERLQEQAVKHVKLGNVICTLPGKTDDVILVTAHFDKVPAGMGVTDNWSGASLLPSLLYGIDGVPRKHTYVFIGFTGEEQGMLGSEFYAQHLTKEQRGKIQAVINMDTLGLGPTEVWTSQADPALVKDLANVATAVHLPISTMNVDRVGTTDSESFARYKIPRMTLHSLTGDTLSILHSNKDQLNVIRADDYYATYKLLTIFLAYLDTKLGQSPEPESAAAGH